MHLVHPAYSHPVVAAEILALAAKTPVYRPADLCPRHPEQVLEILAFEPFGLGVPAGAFYGDVVLRWKRRRALTDPEFPIIHTPEPSVRGSFRDLLLAIPSAHKRSLYVTIYADENVPDAVGVREAVAGIVAELNREGKEFMPVDVRVGPRWKRQLHRLERLRGREGVEKVSQVSGVVCEEFKRARGLSEDSIWRLD